MTSESTLLERIERAVLSAGKRGAGSVRLGIGDDAAILRPRSGRELVMSSDFLIEGVHFLPKYPPKAIGYKALARGVSDLAAMGAAPLGFLLNLALPPERTGAWLDGFLSGVDAAARKLRILLIGGDLASTSLISVCVVVIGDGRRKRMIRRYGARPGDLIYVSGKLGAARLGLEVIRKRFDKRRDASALVGPHYYPQPRLKLGTWLAEHRLATAMMDISDGLSIDLARLCEASQVGARVEADRIPAVSISEQWRRRLNLAACEAQNYALNGGDDYELLFTVPKRQANKLSRAPSGVPLTCIGEITRNSDLLLVDEAGQSSILRPQGWDHFQRP
jgi:thiamine-monophosphate kinase